MKPLSELIVHTTLLVTSAVLAFGVWTRDEAETSTKGGPTVEVWGGKPADIQRIEWEGKKKVTLEARTDKGGRYYIGIVDKQVQVLKPNAPDADPKAEPPKPTQETVRFVAVKAADELAKTLAPFRAIRSLGNFDEGRKKDFGFEEAEGTLRVTIGGAQRALVIGGTTPGGGDRYARDPDTNRLYAITGDLVRSLSYAESRLFERELHAFEAKEITGLKVERGGAVRELVKVKEKTDTWADAASPETADETAGNWVSKVEQLRPSEYVETLPTNLAPDAVVVRVEYLEGRRPRGYLELVKIPGEDGKDDYLVRTEQTRWHAKVLRSAGEQVAQDVTSVVR
ncbi:MAG: DUF4340 domain-containing protein [Polyangiaceae bacterium]|nr:DUF4340 domain-containing protein [Polyangiaceae bacterium]